MQSILFNDRIEKKYQVGISPDGIADLWLDFRSFLAPHGLTPVQEITSVASVYFDNKDCDLLRYSLLGRLMLVRVRSYEVYGRPPRSINDYWVEVKTAASERRAKRRFRVTKSALSDFLNGGGVGDEVIYRNGKDMDRDAFRDLYQETRETVFSFGLNPILLVIYKRLAFQSKSDRLSLDWDVQYHHVNRTIFDYDSWKYPLEEPIGRGDKVILEMKYLEGEIPSWFSELQRQFPIERREYLKPVEGMKFLFQGPLKHHKQATHFLPMIEHYMANSWPLR